MSRINIFKKCCSMNQISDESGLTLIEVIIAIVFIAIIALAAFRGFQFSFNAFSSAGEFMTDSYVTQAEMENQLSFFLELPTNTSEADIENKFLLDPAEAIAESITFEWETSSGLDDFDVDGVTVIIDAIGGEYLEIPFHTYLPIITDVP